MPSKIYGLQCRWGIPFVICSSILFTHMPDYVLTYKEKLTADQVQVILILFLRFSVRYRVVSLWMCWINRCSQRKMVLSSMSKSNETAKTRRKTQMNCRHEGILDSRERVSFSWPFAKSVAWLMVVAYGCYVRTQRKLAKEITLQN